MQLIIVESPTKARTLQGFLGNKYKILSSFGHVRDLPKSALGVDVEHDFEPKYVIPTKARKTITLLKKAAEGVDSVLLSTDPDREGEAIAWHLAQALKLHGPDQKGSGLPYQRITFHEITKGAIEDALLHPRLIDENLVNAQQARRVLDRIVGYKLSPFLWHKVAKGLSAGRVQSVAVRLVADREREILAFKPQEYWEIVATVKNTKNEPMEFDARLAKVGDKTIDKMDIQDKGRADEILAGLEGAKYSVSNLETKETKRNPFAPFTTSTLQQSASKKFHMPSKFTMSVAQQLYEMGLITYHRTDSLNLSEQSLAGAQAYITSAFGTNYWAGHFVRFKTKAKLAQEAHEAIRPTDPAKTIDDAKKEKSLTSAQEKLYKLIWQRFVASQMAPAIFDSANVDILATPETASGAVCAFKATGQTLKFDGFLKVYPTKYEELSLPKMEKEEPLDLVNLASSQHFTKPPARYNEASLIKALEANGIGRPSTYAPTISTIQDRNYIEKDENRYFKPTETGLLVNDLLVQHFPQIVDIGFTAKMEEDFDEVAEGKIDWIKVLQNFYGPFAQNLANKEKEVANKSTLVEMTDKTCPKCGSNLVVKMGRFGKFYACPSYPTCKYTENIAKPNGGLKQEVKCPKCQTGNLVTKRTKKGKIFYGCSNYPNCDFALWDEPTGAKCEKCGSLMVKPIKGNEKCSNKDCETNKKP